MPMNVTTATNVSTGVATSGKASDKEKTLSEKLKEQDVNKTARGTRIVKPGQDMDKNMFLKILAAELKYQNPENAKDGTEYVAQFAQFAGVEQMTNLNSTMKLTGANSLMGKNITLKQTNENGILYSGRVINVAKNGDEIKLKIFMDGYPKKPDQPEEECTKEFNIEDITKIENIESTNPINNSMALLNASSMIGKIVEGIFGDNNNNSFKGIVKSITKDKEGIKVSVVSETGETKDVPLESIVKVTQG